MTNIHERNIDGKTKLVGLLATPIGHSLSPRMHNLGYTLTGINYAYLAFEVGNDELEAAVNGMKAMGAAGFNVSMPNKMKVLDYLDELDDSARYTRASNTVVNKDGKLIGYNTDGLGYVRNLIEHGVELAGKKSLSLALAARQLRLRFSLHSPAFVKLAFLLVMTNTLFKQKKM